MVAIRGGSQVQPEPSSGEVSRFLQKHSGIGSMFRGSLLQQGSKSMVESLGSVRLEGIYTAFEK
jgi:hypothetical protein